MTIIDPDYYDDRCNEIEVFDIMGECQIFVNGVEWIEPLYEEKEK